MKNSKNNKINIIFSSFLVIGYIVCVYFFSSLASQVSGTVGSLIQILMIVLFGLLLFYATRVGEGKQVRRFSLAVLLLIDLPALYAILAALLPALPLHDVIAPQNTAALTSSTGLPSILLTLACVALGYGIPYTFFSGYEIKNDDDQPADVKTVVEGGLAEELAKTEETASASENAIEEAVGTTAEAVETEKTAEAVEETAEEETADIADEISNETEEEV